MKSKIININNKGKVRFSTQGMKIFNGISLLVANNVDHAFNPVTNFRGNDLGALKWLYRRGLLGYLQFFCKWDILCIYGILTHKWIILTDAVQCSPKKKFIFLIILKLKIKFR